MKYFLLLMIFFTCANELHAEKDSTRYYDLPDSIIATSFITDISFHSVSIKKEISAGITASGVSLMLEGDKKEREVEFSFPSDAKIIAKGLDVDEEKNELEWKYEWKPNTAYKLLIATAADSAGNFVLYSGYIFLPETGKWKLIGTCRVNGLWTAIKSPASFVSGGKIADAPGFTNTWIQRSNGSWKSLEKVSNSPQPIINLMPNVDSLRQYQSDKLFIEKTMTSVPGGNGAIWPSKEGVYYQVDNPGNGISFTSVDTVTVFYKLRIFGTGEVISGGSEKPDTFPLNRLIKAWQIALPLVKTGGKIRLVIPSGQGYSIRTRAPKIPPNSILEFEIEVVDAKPAVK